MTDKLSRTILLITALISSMFVWVGCTNNRESAGSVQPAPVVEQAVDLNDSADRLQTRLLEEQWGIKIERAVLSAGGYMIDFRFRVLDAAKAKPLLERKTRPYLTDQATGAMFVVPAPPKIGQLRSGGNIREGAIYFILFANPGRYIKSGNKVTVVVGDFEAPNILVQ